MSRSLSALALAVLALAGPRAWGQARPPAPVFGVGLELVNVSVSVRDGAGRLVTDLTAEDFRVYEDGQRRPLRLFARAADPEDVQALVLDLGLLMDTSESMIDVLRMSQAAAVRFLESVPRARDLLTIFFDEEIRISRFDSEHQQGLFDRIWSAKGGGRTALYDAITVYVSRAQEAPGRKVLVLFTDGEDTTSDVTAAEVVQMLRASSVTVYPILISSLPHGTSRALRSSAFLNEIAELSGGQVFRPVAASQLGGVYQTILEELSAQYVIGIAPDDTQRHARFRRLKVELVRPGLKLRYRQGYYAPGAPQG